MGRKSISNRMPKKSRPFTSVDIRGLAREPVGEHAHLTSSKNNVDTLFNREGSHSAVESNKAQEKQ